jgi:hypothetical protein
MGRGRKKDDFTTSHCLSVRDCAGILCRHIVHILCRHIVQAYCAGILLRHIAQAYCADILCTILFAQGGFQFLVCAVLGWCTKPYVYIQVGKYHLLRGLSREAGYCLQVEDDVIALAFMCLEPHGARDPARPMQHKRLLQHTAQLEPASRRATATVCKLARAH